MQFTRRRFKLAALTGLCSAWLGPVWGRRSPALAQALDVADQTTAGPMVGAVTPVGAAIWMYTPSDARIEVRAKARIFPDDGQRARVEKIPTDRLGVAGQPWKATFGNLKPNTLYDYQVTINGTASPEHRGSFRTPPPVGAPAKFRLGLTSCMKIEKPQTSWPLFLEQKPDLHLSLGDTVYSDSTDPRVQWRHHLRYRQTPAFASVIRAMPNYTMWDDHDYGPNNSDGTEPGKEDSLSGWKRVWLNPGAGTQEVPGAFYTFAWGDVEFFVADGRYHRTPNRAADDERKTMLGAAQFDWLIDGLKASKAKFKIVASGSTLEHSQADGWRVFTHERRRLFDAIKANQIDGVSYFSGSPHTSWAWEHHESDRVGYPLVEVVSSGIANGKRLSFATIDFDTIVDDPTMSVRIVQGTGKVSQQDTWKLSQLSHA